MWRREGDEVKMAVEEVGTGVGYVLVSSNVSRLLFSGRGKAGEDEKGSNAGSRPLVGRVDFGVGDTVVSERVAEGAMTSCVLAIPR